jgi:hypothetical protein
MILKDINFSMFPFIGKAKDLEKGVENLYPL